MKVTAVKAMIAKGEDLSGVVHGNKTFEKEKARPLAKGPVCKCPAGSPRTKVSQATDGVMKPLAGGPNHRKATLHSSKQHFWQTKFLRGKDSTGDYHEELYDGRKRQG